jgi:hypothetical protein
LIQRNIQSAEKIGRVIFKDELSISLIQKLNTNQLALSVYSQDQTMTAFSRMINRTLMAIYDSEKRDNKVVENKDLCLYTQLTYDEFIKFFGFVLTRHPSEKNLKEEVKTVMLEDCTIHKDSARDQAIIKKPAELKIRLKQTKFDAFTLSQKENKAKLMKFFAIARSVYQAPNKNSV